MVRRARKKGKGASFLFCGEEEAARKGLGWVAVEEHGRGFVAMGLRVWRRRKGVGSYMDKGEG